MLQIVCQHIFTSSSQIKAEIIAFSKKNLLSSDVNGIIQWIQYGWNSWLF